MKVAVFGLGNFGTRWVERVLAYDQESCVYGISHRNFQEIESAGILNNKPRFHLMNKCPEGNIDLCIICTPATIDVRTKLTNSLAAKTKFLIIEKPISTSYQSSKLIAQHLKSSNCRFLVGYQYRFHDLVAHARKLIQNNENIETVKVSHNTNMARWHPYKDYTQSISSDITRGGGCLHELSHSIDLLEAIMPSWEIVQMSSEVRYQSDLMLKKGTDAGYDLKLTMVNKDKRRINVEINVAFDSNQESRAIEIFNQKWGTYIDLISNCITTNNVRAPAILPPNDQFNETLLNRELAYAYSVIKGGDAISEIGYVLPSNGLFAAKICERARKQSLGWT